MSEDKEFVTYVQSLALKELGFDEPCFAYYGLNNVEDKLFFDIDPDDGELTSLNQNQFYHNNLSEIGRISAPLKQQVFRWFRDKHSLEIILRPDAINVPEKKLREYVILSYDKKWILTPIAEPHWWTRKGLFKTYDEAESACIDKLITIVK